MVKCNNIDCLCNHCCIECDAQKSKGGQCGCDIAEDLEFNRKEILEKCKYATEDRK